MTMILAYCGGNMSSRCTPRDAHRFVTAVHLTKGTKKNKKTKEPKTIVLMRNIIFFYILHFSQIYEQQTHFDEERKNLTNRFGKSSNLVRNRYTF